MPVVGLVRLRWALGSETLSFDPILDSSRSGDADTDPVVTRCDPVHGEGVKIPGEGGSRGSHSHLARRLLRRQRWRRGPRGNLDGSRLEGASRRARCIAQACNCGRRGRIRVSDVQPLLLPAVERRAREWKRSTRVRERLWNLVPLKTTVRRYA